MTLPSAAPVFFLFLLGPYHSPSSHLLIVPTDTNVCICAYTPDVCAKDKHTCHSMNVANFLSLFSLPMVYSEMKSKFSGLHIRNLYLTSHLMGPILPSDALLFSFYAIKNSSEIIII